jgi:fructoselysine-6-P-deglycase FrlB-like protein
MGRPYDSELAKLEGTYDWCVRADVAPLARFFALSNPLPLMIVGSGGSFATAAFAAMLHERYSERLARAATALDAAASAAIRNTAVLFISAGGRHPDILGAFRCVARMEPRHLAACCGTPSSPLGELVRKSTGASYFSFPFPVRKDGFLATNSVLAFAVLLLRASLAAYSSTLQLPSFESLDPTGVTNLIRATEQRTVECWSFPNILLLHGPTGTAAALDFESRFHEAGLAAVQVTDLRNFAHGRHYWLERHSKSTCVIALTSSDEAQLARATLALLPPGISRTEVSVSNSGPIGAIELLLLTIYMAGWSGRSKGLDPGRPSVPDFGRRIYHLNAWARGDERDQELLAPIWRKSGRSHAVLQSGAERQEWEAAHAEFISDLELAKFAGIVLDYDDTVCTAEERRTQPSKLMASELNRLLEGGAWIGIATGRGKSVRKSLRKVIRRQFWNRVLVGYYNGAQVAPLRDASKPNISKQRIKGALNEFLGLLNSNSQLKPLLVVEANAAQVKIEPTSRADLREVARWIQHIIGLSKLPIRAVISSRSLDVIPIRTTKNRVIGEIRRACGRSASILCVGDSGEWPGNDYELLSNRHALSSDSTSPDRATCWNLAPVGLRCAD